MSNEFWVLYNPSQKTQTDKFTSEQIQFSLMKMKTKDINIFLIWRSDWQKWKKLNEFLASDESPFMNTFINSNSLLDNADSNQPLAIKMKPVEKETAALITASFSNVQLEEVRLKDVNNTSEQQFDGDNLTSDAVNVNSNLNFKSLDKFNAFAKNNKEHKFKLELLLIHPNGTMFRTIAKDISLSGVFGERIIPDDFHHTVFDLVIINNFITDDRYNRLTLKTKAVVTGASIYLEYVKATELQKESLRAILEYYVRASKKINT